MASETAISLSPAADSYPADSDLANEQEQRAAQPQEVQVDLQNQSGTTQSCLQACPNDQSECSQTPNRLVSDKTSRAFSQADHFCSCSSHHVLLSTAHNPVAVLLGS